MRATRERLRERRKHRHRSRNHPPHHHTPDAPSTATTPTKNGPTRPRSQSAASRLPSRSSVGAGAPDARRGGSGGLGGERKAAGPPNAGVSVRLTPIPSLMRWLTSYAAVPWLLLAFVFLCEGLQWLRFSSETAGFLEAAETAMSVLGASVEGTDGEEGDAVSRAVLKEELARALVSVYSRHRFLWPLNRLH